MSPPPERPPERSADRRTRVRGIITLAFATVSFAASLALRDRFDPWRSTALAAVVGMALSAWTLGPRLRPLFAVSRRGVVFAAVLGVALVAATHAGFAVIRLISPELGRTVRGLYSSIDVGDSPALLALLATFVVIGEELIWRGVAVAIARSPSPSRVAIGALSVGLYVLPQLPGHVPVLIAAATGLGAIFAAQRLVTGRLTDPIITHAIWSTCVFVLLPVS
ncbi:MAG TPA: CPBP family intramembrane glutamic endopeptidase [Kofleriaceae bacterium]